MLEEQGVVVPSTPEATPTETVDNAPDPASLMQDIERLKQVREQKEKEAKEAEEKAIYWRKQKAETRAEFFKTRTEDRRPPQEIPEESFVPEVGLPPRADAFESYDKYVEALTDYKTNARIAQWQRDQEIKAKEAQYGEKMRTLQERLEEGFTKYPDFEEVAKDPTLPITAIVRDAIAESEAPADVAYYLGKNRMEAIRLSRMTPMAVAREIAKIEMRVKSDPPITPKLPSAPPPIKPTGSSNVVQTPLDKMSQKEFEAYMEKATGRKY